MRGFGSSNIVLIALAVCAGVAAVPAFAQSGFVQPLTSDADALASEMRRLAANPRDLNALIRAGELAVTLGDPTAAAGFFARAEQIDPRNARVKAGIGTLLVLAERPGEALRRFAEAEALGLGVQAYAAHRGLAYDLIGEQERAQRDYRLALQGGSNDETTRRYALSLGISGKRDEALALLDAMLRRSDRGAWRSRAFILAMNGDSAGAERIATSMMPAGLAYGLQPFFARLGALSPADRAFAVHFGELRPTPERIADARLVPQLAPLPFEPGRVTQMAAAVASPSAVRHDRRSRKARERDRAKLALAVPPPARPLPEPPGYSGAILAAAPVALAVNRPIASYPPVGPVARASSSRPVAPAAVPSAAIPVAAGSAATVWRNGAAIFAPAPAPIAPGRIPSATAVPATRSPPVAVTFATSVSAPANQASPASAVSASAPVATPSVSSIAIDAKRVAEPVLHAAPAAATVSLATAAAPSSTVSVTASQVQALPSSAAPVAAVSEFPIPAPVSGNVSPSPAIAVVPPRPALSEDSILARIVSSIAVPGSELDVEPVVAAGTPSARALASPVPSEPIRADTTAKIAAEAARAKTAADARIADAKKTADTRALAARKVAADKKLLSDKKALSAKMVAADRKAEIAKQDQARIWVQVAGGANQGDLPKEWARVVQKAPAAFKGKQGWSTPLRATNRVLAGPFTTEAAARAFVNMIAKAGVSGFTFTSAAGQKIVKLPPK